jgi:hypothetical protein
MCTRVRESEIADAHQCLGYTEDGRTICRRSIPDQRFLTTESEKINLYLKTLSYDSLYYHVNSYIYLWGLDREKFCFSEVQINLFLCVDGYTWMDMGQDIIISGQMGMATLKVAV